MKTVTYSKFGSPDVLELKDFPIPVPKDNQVLVRIKSTSVNPVDYKVRKGILKPFTKYRLPITPGGDFSGIIEKIEFGVEEFQPGQEVFGLTPAVRGGAYSEYAVINKNNLWHKPENLSFEQAAAIPLAGLTALQGLYDRGKIKPNMRVLINGCTGGVGSFAVQIAKAYDAEVWGVCSSANVDFAKELGVDYIIEYNKENPAKGSNKYDLVFDVSGKLKYKNFKDKLYHGGRFVSTLPSFSLLAHSIINKDVKFMWVDSNCKDLQNLKSMAEKKIIKPYIDKIFYLEQAGDAHDHCENNSVRGKVVIKV